jgi:hypothetical protein
MLHRFAIEDNDNIPFSFELDAAGQAWTRGGSHSCLYTEVNIGFGLQE